MTVAVPLPQWPSSLIEAGPDGDRTILLRGLADIGGAAYAVLAIRVDPISLRVDRLDVVASRVYADLQLDDMLDDISSYTEITDASLVRLDSGTYVMLMIPPGISE
jgi:hypothetical protein